MGIGQNLQDMVSAEAAGLAAVIIIFFGIKFWLSKETGKLIASIAILAVCLTFILAPDVISTFLTSVVKQILGGAS